jgi:hypothetical protein
MHSMPEDRVGTGSQNPWFLVFNSRGIDVNVAAHAGRIFLNEK